MKLITLSRFILLSSVVLFYSFSHLVFQKVFSTSVIIIDEEFHLPQGLEYCNFTFNRWNPKITTLPGLYLITAALLGPFQLCSVYWLRYINLIASVLNLCLFYVSFSLYNKRSFWANLLGSINLSLLPPLYFFNHLYYTDVISLTFILLLIIFNKKEQHLFASIFGMCSVVMRQTNIIWVMMILGQYLLREYVLLHQKKQKKESEVEISFTDLWYSLKRFEIGLFLKFLCDNWINFSAYISVIVTFALFVVINGSIVVGDKTAHTATIHIPQLFYYFLFSLIFGWPYFITYLTSFKEFILKNKYLTLIITTSMLLIISQNTLEHPYLLADNRHYTFYIWNRFYRKYFFFRYLMVLIYYFSSFCVFSILRPKSKAHFFIMYIGSITGVLILQKMIEVRYFLLPYVLLRLQYKNSKIWQLLSEFITFFLINVLTFNIFLTKDIYWSNFDYVQKLIW